MSNENAKFKYSVFVTEKIEKEYIIYCDDELNKNLIKNEFEDECYHNSIHSLLIGKIDNKKVATKMETLDSIITEIETI